MTNNVNISVQGGAVSLGNVAQGNDNQVTASVSFSAIDQSFQGAHSGISSLGRELQVPIDQIEKALSQLEKLKAEAQAVKLEPEKGATILSVIRQNYSWAYPLAKDFVSIAWPALLAIVA